MTLAIIAFTVVISLLGLNDQRVFQKLVFEPYTIHARKDWFRFLTDRLECRLGLPERSVDDRRRHRRPRTARAELFR